MDELDENWVDEIFGLQGFFLLFVSCRTTVSWSCKIKPAISKLFDAGTNVGL